MIKMLAYMSSTHIQSDRDSVVSVQTQSMTARSSTKNGTRRNLHTPPKPCQTVVFVLFKDRHVHSSSEVDSHKARSLYSDCTGGQISATLTVPLEEKQVEVVVFLGEEVAEDTGGVTTADLIGWQAKVNALYEVPELGHKVLIKHPGNKRKRE